MKKTLIVTISILAFSWSSITSAAENVEHASNIQQVKSSSAGLDLVVSMYV